MLFITPLPVFGRGAINDFIDYLFTNPTAWIRNNVLNSPSSFDGFYTDSLNYALLLFFGLLIGLILAFLATRFFQKSTKFLGAAVSIALTYYLAWVFLIYGFSKILGIQFPEISDEHILSEINPKDKDLLFWTYMGMNRSLVLILGFAEISIACLLFIRKTRKLGLLLFTLTMAQIVLINFSFDISVQMLSSLLFLIALVLSKEAIIQIFAALFKEKRVVSKLPNIEMNKSLHHPLKIMIISLLIISALYTSL